MSASDSPYTIALIPAKLTSRRIPQKNLALIAGQALYAYSVRAGLRTQGIHETFVSSESQEVLSPAAALGALPILRPSALSEATVTNFQVIEHALQHVMALRGRAPDLLVLLQPTHPFRWLQDLSDAIRVMHEDQVADSLFALREVDEIGGESSDGYFLPNGQEPSVPLKKRTHYVNTGSFYVLRPERTIAQGSLFGTKIRGFTLSRPDMEIDIDRPEQLAMARGLADHLKSELEMSGLLVSET